MKIFYFPLEPYKERYTVQLSAPKTGWLESRWVENGIDYIRMEGEKINLDNSIKTGSVLDACGRGHWACTQIGTFLKHIDLLKPEDVLYFDDFWHPGIEAIYYAFHLMGLKNKMFAMLHAQSIDKYDFTYPMRHWMRPFEIGIGKILSGIFVTSTGLKDLCIYNGIGKSKTVHLCGLPYNSEEVMTHFPEVIPMKKKQVIFSSRWDKEKRPDIFLKIMERVLCYRPDIKFVVTTSSEEIKSNYPPFLKRLEKYKKRFNRNLDVRVNQTKEQYYYNLLESRIQINTADQDWVSWTLLEATTCGCIPLYPDYLSFPEVLENEHNFLYNKNDIDHATKKIIEHIDSLIGSLYDFHWVYSKFDKSWQRMYNVMKGEEYENLYNN